LSISWARRIYSTLSYRMHFKTCFHTTLTYMLRWCPIRQNFFFSLPNKLHALPNQTYWD
jgi:hypothetical protein